MVSLRLTASPHRPSTSTVVLIVAATEETSIRPSLAMGAAKGVPLVAVSAGDIAASGVAASMAGPRPASRFLAGASVCAINGETKTRWLPAYGTGDARPIETSGRGPYISAQMDGRAPARVVALLAREEGKREYVVPALRCGLLVSIFASSGTSLRQVSETSVGRGPVGAPSAMGREQLSSRHYLHH